MPCKGQPCAAFAYGAMCRRAHMDYVQHLHPFIYIRVGFLLKALQFSRRKSVFLGQQKSPVRENEKGRVWRLDSAEEKPALNHSSLTGAFKGRNRISLNSGARAEAKWVSLNARVCEKTAAVS